MGYTTQYLYSEGASMLSYSVGRTHVTSGKYCTIRLWKRYIYWSELRQLFPNINISFLTWLLILWYTSKKNKRDTEIDYKINVNVATPVVQPLFGFPAFRLAVLIRLVVCAYWAFAQVFMRSESEGNIFTVWKSHLFAKFRHNYLVKR